jgi:hypothetical protein
MNQPPPAPLTLGQFLPLLLLSLILGVLLFSMAKRKGKSPAVALIALIPLANMIYAIWLCSLTDAAVLKDLEELKRAKL